MAKKAKFTPEQAAQLAAAVAAVPEGTGRRWVRVAERVAGGKDASQCRAHWFEVLEPKALGLKVGDWSAAEDECLQQAVVKMGTHSWQSITDLFPGRDKTGVKNHYYTLVRLQKRAAAKKVGDSRGARAAPSRAARSPAPAGAGPTVGTTSLSPRTGPGSSQAAGTALFAPVTQKLCWCCG